MKKTLLLVKQVFIYPFLFVMISLNAVAQDNSHNAKNSLNPLRRSKYDKAQNSKEKLVSFRTVNKMPGSNKKKKIQHGSFSFNYGISSPAGVYGSDNLDEDGAGLAMGGSIKSFRFSYIFQDRIGIGICYKKHKNDVDVYAIEDYYTTNIKVESKSPWIVNSILIGPSVNLVYIDEMAFDIDFQCGFSFVKSPELSISRFYFDSSYEEPGKGEVLSLSSNAQLLLFMSDSFSFHIGLGYLTTKPRIANYNNEAKQAINVLELDFGLGVRIK